MVTCLYSGSDGTQAFAQYYKSPKMYHDLRRRTHLFLTINQYIGKCLIDNQITREEVKKMTYQAYQYFWTHVIDHSLIPQIHYDFEQLTVAYVRLGDHYLCDKNPNVQQPLKDCYQWLTTVPLNSHFALIGDIDNQSMNQCWNSLNSLNSFHPNGITTTLIDVSGTVSHSCGHLSLGEWEKIFHDLYLMYHADQVVILNNDSNFTRIVLFLDRPDPQQIYLLKDHHLSLITDTSLIFAKHYQF
jgi:hypothetical protein